MAALTPRKPYTDDELRNLYPPGLQLQQVQILMRHGERTPVSARFQNTGLQAFWPYCASVRHFKSAVLQVGALPNKPTETRFTTLEWKRRMEAFGPADEPVVASGPKGEVDDICDMGSLTDTGRLSTYRLGMRLRSLYVDRLKFLPAIISSHDFLYLRSTPVPRALESLQQTYSALYPPSARKTDHDNPVPTILTRTYRDETLYPNEGNCRRLLALKRAFVRRTADRWNKTEQMDYLNKLYGRWMPAESPRVAVDSHPSVSGIMDTINATLAHGPETRLPREFYDEKGKRIIQEIAVEEWFSGFQESREFRMLGVGSLLGDIVGRMVRSAERNPLDSQHHEAKDSVGTVPIRFGLSGCHDTTLAGVLVSLGVGLSEWPSFTSHIAIELFRQGDEQRSKKESSAHVTVAKPSWWSRISSSSPPSGIGRKPMSDLTAGESGKLEGYFVRMRYNDEPVTVPTCQLPGNHLDGDETFCTLAAFKSVVDKFTPTNWKQQCNENMEVSAFRDVELARH